MHLHYVYVCNLMMTVILKNGMLLLELFVLLLIAVIQFNFERGCVLECVLLAPKRCCAVVAYYKYHKFCCRYFCKR